MEDYLTKTLVLSSVLLFLSSVLRLVYVIWWRPVQLDKYLRNQGIGGTSYKLLHGDMQEISRSTMEALSKPIPLNHHIAPRVLPFFHNMVQTYGKVCRCWYGRRARVIIGDTEKMRSILANKRGDFMKPPLNPLVDLLQMGVSTLEGQQWSNRRRLIAPSFNLDKLKGMMPAFSTSCSILIQRWKDSISGEGSCELDVAPEFQNLASDVIARTAFGSCYEDGKTIFQLQKEQVVLVLQAYNSIYFPGLRFIPTRKNNRRYKLDREIKTILRDMIDMKLKAMQKGDSGPKDLLDLLLQCKDEAHNSLRIEDIIEECKLLYFAGQETTANLLTWTMILLSMHPDWQEKARQEVLRVCGNKSTTIDLEAINRLKIVSMILHEVLRLYPPVTLLFRYTKRKTRIGEFSVPAGVEILLPTLFLHYDPKYWGGDVEEFNPERFSGGVANASKDDHIAFYPFGWGPRICLGQNFAMIEAKMALSMILQQFSFHLSPSYAHAPCTVITLQPQHGAPIVLHQI